MRRTWIAARIACAAACAACAGRIRPDPTPPLAARVDEEAAREAARREPDASPPLDARERTEHLLSRATFGPTDELRAEVASRGVAAFLEEQLDPDRLDDARLDARLADNEVARASTPALLRALTELRQRGPPPGPPPPPPEGARLSSAERVERERELRQGLFAQRRDLVQALAQAKVTRAVFSRRQLREVLVDFWFNHFNVFAGKDDEAALLPAYESLLREGALGSFAGLLEGVARSPAMLLYLDNWRSSSPGVWAQRRGVWVEGPARKGRGLNENWARELLELHTLGVDGGYTQEDVVAVARCFTGWTVDRGAGDLRFVFRPELHDRGEKRVLGQLIPAGGGEEDGVRVLHLLEAHPSTARFVARKLVRRFVADEPPAQLVERVAQVYARTSGDVRSMLRAIFSSPEFWSRRALRAKVRSPFELVAAAARATSFAPGDPQTLVQAIARIGEPLYGAQPPTGYGDTAETWLSPGPLLARIDFGVQLANGQLGGAAPVAGLQGALPGEVVDRTARRLGAVALSERTRRYVLAQVQEAPADARVREARALGLLLGSPELQRR